MKFLNKCLNVVKKHDITIVRVLMLMLFSLILTICTEWVVRGNLSEAINCVRYSLGESES